MKDNYKTVWAKCLQIIKENLGPDNDTVYRTWFEPIVPIQLEDNVLTIQVPSQFFYEWLEEHFIDLLKHTIRLMLGPSGMLKYSILMDTSIGHKPITTSVPSSGRQNITNRPTVLPFVGSKGHEEQPIRNPFIIPGIQKQKIPSNLNGNYTFSNFVEGDCNRLARNAGLRVAQDPGHTSFNPLLLYSNVGLGKTHLAQAIGVQTKEMHPDKTVHYVTSEQFLQQYSDAGRNGFTNDFVHYYEAIDVLIIDDIQFWSNKAAGTQEAFFHIFNHLHQKNCQIIITSDKAPCDLNGLQPRLLSRLKWGLGAELTMPDAPTRIAIIRQKLANDGIELPDEVIDYIGYNVHTNVRELEGALVSLIAQSSLNRRQITTALAKEIIDKFIRNITREVTIEYIQKVVCDYFQLPVESILETSRKREIVQARQLTMYLAKKLTKSSLAAIGERCGNKDHATVLHACRTVANLVEHDEQVELCVRELERKIRE